MNGQWLVLIVWLSIRHSCTSNDHLMCIKDPFEVLLCWIPVNHQLLVLIVWLSIRHNCISNDHLMYTKDPLKYCCVEFLVLTVWLSITTSFQMIISCISKTCLKYCWNSGERPIASLINCMTQYQTQLHFNRSFAIYHKACFSYTCVQNVQNNTD